MADQLNSNSGPHGSERVVAAVNIGVMANGMLLVQAQGLAKGISGIDQALGILCRARCELEMRARAPAQPQVIPPPVQIDLSQLRAEGQ